VRTPPSLVRVAVPLLLAAAAIVSVPTARAAGPGPAAATLAAAVAGPTLHAMVAFDAAYIPALAATSAAALDPKAAGSARAAAQALQGEWPGLRARLATAWGEREAPGWAGALQRVDRHIAGATQAVQRGDWSVAHDQLEEVRVELMQARRAQGMDYFVDRLTAYHEPMEVLALAGATLKPAELTHERREALATGWRQASSMWAEIERFAVPAEAYGLTVQRKAQLDQGIAQERAALDTLGSAVRSADAVDLLKAAAAIKPPFARVFTAFGRDAGPRAP